MDAAFFYAAVADVAIALVVFEVPVVYSSYKIYGSYRAFREKSPHSQLIPIKPQFLRIRTDVLS